MCSQRTPAPSRKHCNSSNIVKLIDDFTKDRVSPTGHAHIRKACCAIREKSRRHGVPVAAKR